MYEPPPPAMASGQGRGIGPEAGAGQGRGRLGGQERREGAESGSGRGQAGSRGRTGASRETWRGGGGSRRFEAHAFLHAQILASAESPWDPGNDFADMHGYEMNVGGASTSTSISMSRGTPTGPRHHEEHISGLGMSLKH